MEGHLVECSKDQPLSRHIQKRLEDGSGSSSNQEARKEKDLLFKEVMQDDPLALMKDKFGNYVVQKMFDFGSLEQRGLLLSVMKGKVLELSMDQHGCRVVQQSLEKVTNEQQLEVIAEIQGNEISCIENESGNHVI